MDDMFLTLGLSKKPKPIILYHSG